MSGAPPLPTAPPPPPPGPSHSTKRRRIGCLPVLLILIVLAAAAAVLLGLRYAPVLGDAAEVQAAARRLANQARALTPAKLDRGSVEGLRTSLGELESRLDPMRRLLSDDPLVAMARGVPVVGSQVQAADALIGAADSLVEAGDIGLDLAEEVVALREAEAADPEISLMPGIVELIATSGADVDRIADLVATADAELATIPDGVVGQLREARDLVGEPLAAYGPLLESYRELDDVLPGLLGWGEEKTYLVLAQNPAELRPSGGYAGTIGTITLRDGQVVEQRFVNASDMARVEGLPFVEPPDELATYLLGDDQSWRIADANWAADFPEAARKSLEMYAIETGEDDIDGVIAITTYALDRLLEVLGPVEVPRYGITVEPGDVTLTLLGATRGSPGNVQGRKEVLDVLARRTMARLMSLPPQRWAPALEALGEIGMGRDALVWLADEPAQQLVEQAGWAGRVRHDPGDYLYVVESNVAPTSKYNIVIDRADTLVVRLDANGDAVNSLRLDWDSATGRDGQPYEALREFSTNQDGLYGAYVRVLTPAGSELVTTSGQASDPIGAVERVGTEAGRASFANYLLMPPGDSTLSYLWTVPGAAVQTDAGWLYELVIQRQPGASDVKLSVRVDLPEGATVLEAPEGATVEGSQVRMETTLDQDVELSVHYELAE